MNQSPPSMRRAGAMLVAVAVALWAAPAAAADPVARDPLWSVPGAFAFKIEAGAALALTEPQVGRFLPGGGATLKALWAINRYLSVGPSGSLTLLRTSDGADVEAGTAWTAGASLRVARPHDALGTSSWSAISPWIDADALYIRTGALHRQGFAAAIGVSLPIGASRVVWLGPYARYLHIVQGERPGFDNGDAQIVTAGLSLELGSGVERPPAVRVVTRVETVTQTVVEKVKEVEVVTKETFVCRDRDGDRLPDEVDHCPDVAGPIESLGCPVYKKVVVKKDKLELKEKIFFDFNKATIKKVSHSLLDDVVQALQDNHGFHVRIEGHTSSEGSLERNQELSEGRAQAVRDYLIAHGVRDERLIAKGFGPANPIDSNRTISGREANRRVEFVVQQQASTQQGSN